MYEICALLKNKAPKATKPLAPRKPPVTVGANVEVMGRAGVVTRRDEKYPAAWFVAFDKGEAPYSFSRDMIHIVAA